MSSTAALIRSAAYVEPSSTLTAEVLGHLDTDFHDLDDLLGRSGGAGPSKRPKKRRTRTLDEEIAHWEKQERAAAQEVNPLS